MQSSSPHAQPVHPRAELRRDPTVRELLRHSLHVAVDERASQATSQSRPIAASKRRGKGAAPIAPLALEAVRRIREYQESCGSQADLQLNRAWECARTGHSGRMRKRLLPHNCHTVLGALLHACRLEGVRGRHERHDVRARHASRTDDGHDAGRIAQFESDLLGERVKSGLAAARVRGKKLGCQPGQRPKPDRLAPKVLNAIDGGRSYRWIVRDLGISH